MNTGQTLKLGIDIGSTTAKVVLLTPGGDMPFSAYRRHNTETLTALQSIVREALDRLGDQSVSLMITGSAGMGLAETYGLPFIQEVVASAGVINRQYPGVRTLIDIGGEDAKIIFYDDENRPDIRMNGSCAGGTGAFIDEMATLLGVPLTSLNGLAERSTAIYPMASRCGVFAKTDLQNLISRQVPKEDIAASVFHAVVLQTLATLARGRDVKPGVLFSGGPFTFMPALRASFIKTLNLTPANVIDAASPELLPAMGAALAEPAANRLTTTLGGLLDILAEPKEHTQTSGNRHAALFESPRAFDEWTASRAGHRIERVDPVEAADGDYFLGIDSGSTTTKIVLIDETGRVAFSDYANNDGNSIHAVQAGLERLRETLTKAGGVGRFRIARSVVTGYGEDLIRAAFGLDEGMVETMAHYRAARAFDPQVSFILDIGGQDMKAIFIRDGQIQNIEINEACSSGCGSFIQSFARNMGYGVADFAKLACESDAPYNLGTRCTVFMNSRVKQALREGAGIDDISAGLAYSVIKNALHKVLKITNIDVLGSHIVVQGGTFRNPAVQKALEELIGRPVVCPDLAELMGAYGAALTGRDAWLTGETAPGTFIGLDQAHEPAGYERKEIHCRGCENRCGVTKLTFPNGNSFYSGNRCERIYSNGGPTTSHGVNLPAEKYALLFDRADKAAGVKTRPGLTLGIPRVLNMYENFPFWHTLFTECGLNVRLSDPSSNAVYQDGAGYIMSDNLCFPGKLVSGHIINLVKAGVDRIFYPMVFYEKNEFTDANNTYNCPVVAGYPEVIRSALNPAERFNIPLDMPAFSLRDEKLLAAACVDYLGGLGVRKETARAALTRALAEQRAFKAALVRLGAEAIRNAAHSGRRVILLMGRPYHIDPLINHNIPGLLTDFGVDVITEDSIPMEGEALQNRHVMTQWEYMNRYFHAARWVAQSANVELVQLNSFGCGPDPFLLEEVRSILEEKGKTLTVIRIDEIESTGSTRLRLRSMMEALTRADDAPQPLCQPRVSTKVYTKEDRSRTLLLPDFSPFTSPPIVRPLIDLGYNIVQLPEADHTSVDTGLKYTNNELCYPAIITLGDIVKALQSGQYDPATTAVGFSQTGGQCRATSYPSMIKKALVAAGFAQVPVVTLSTSLNVLNDQPGFKLNAAEYIYKAAVGMMFHDALSEMFHATVIREKNRGETQAVVDRHLRAFMDGSLEVSVGVLLNRLRRAVKDFNAIETVPGLHPLVGIVGEIYVKYNAFSNNHAADWLMEQGLEVVMPGFFEFFEAGMLSNGHAVATHVKNRDLTWLMNSLGRRMTGALLHRFDSVMQSFDRHRPHASIQQVADLASGILSLNHQYGEGWLIGGEIADYARRGVNNVLCLQPFGCIANHVIAKGVQKRIQETLPQVNLLFLDADAGVSEVNFFNRMHFFVNNAWTALPAAEPSAHSC